MSEEDRIELKKELSVYSKEELLEKYIDELEENHILTDQWYKSSQRINSAKEYITSYESIDTIQQNEIPENNIGLDEDTFVEMVRRYMIVHDKVLEILDKVEEK